MNAAGQQDQCERSTCEMEQGILARTACHEKWQIYSDRAERPNNDPTVKQIFNDVALIEESR